MVKFSVYLNRRVLVMNITCAHNKDSEQPAHPYRLIKVFCCRLEDALDPLIPTKCFVKIGQTALMRGLI